MAFIDDNSPIIPPCDSHFSMTLPHHVILALHRALVVMCDDKNFKSKFYKVFFKPTLMDKKEFKSLYDETVADVELLTDSLSYYTPEIINNNVVIEFVDDIEIQQELKNNELSNLDFGDFNIENN